jgi:hypothetical protein
MKIILLEFGRQWKNGILDGLRGRQGLRWPVSLEKISAAEGN